MANNIVTREQLYAWFTNNEKPTQEQFFAWLDSFWHKQEKIPQVTITGLDEVLAGLFPKGGLDNFLKADGSNVTALRKLLLREKLGIGGRNLGTVNTKADMDGFEALNGDFFATSQKDESENKPAGTIWHYVLPNDSETGRWEVFSEPGASQISGGGSGENWLAQTSLENGIPDGWDINNVTVTVENDVFLKRNGAKVVFNNPELGYLRMPSRKSKLNDGMPLYFTALIYANVNMTIILSTFQGSGTSVKLFSLKQGYNSVVQDLANFDLTDDYKGTEFSITFRADDSNGTNINAGDYATIFEPMLSEQPSPFVPAVEQVDGAIGSEGVVMAGDISQL